MTAKMAMVTRIKGRDIPIEFIVHQGSPCMVVSCADIAAVTPDVFAKHCVDNKIIGTSCTALMISHDHCVCQN